MKRYWPLGSGRIVTSPFGPRQGGFHTGVDFGRPGGSGGMPVYAIQSGTVLYAGSAQGYGGDESGLCGWLVVDSSDDEGGGVLEYGHIRRLATINVGDKVGAGQQIAVINPDSRTNGGTAPHLHVSDMPGSYAPSEKQDLMPRLRGALEPGGSVVAAVGRPDFNEYWVKSPSFSSRNGAKVDLLLLHTQEGAGNADSLARFLADGRNSVSYHYTVSQDPVDGGVTVCDVVDTDQASWSCLSANSRSINLCFAGSSVRWSRQDWLKQSKAIDVAAYLFVQDAKKYGVPLRMLAPAYNSPPPGIADHNYVTKYLRDGSHTDTGPNFPWDVFSAAIQKYSQQDKPVQPTPVAPPKPPTTPVAPAPTVTPPTFKYPSKDDMLVQVWEQLFGPQAKGWPQLGNKSLVDAVADIKKKIGS